MSVFILRQAGDLNGPGTCVIYDYFDRDFITVNRCLIFIRICTAPLALRIFEGIFNRTADQFEGIQQFEQPLRCRRTQLIHVVFIIPFFSQRQRDLIDGSVVFDGDTAQVTGGRRGACISLNRIFSNRIFNNLSVLIFKWQIRENTAPSICLGQDQRFADLLIFRKQMEGYGSRTDFVAVIIVIPYLIYMDADLFGFRVGVRDVVTVHIFVIILYGFLMGGIYDCASVGIILWQVREGIRELILRPVFGINFYTPERTIIAMQMDVDSLRTLILMSFIIPDLFHCDLSHIVFVGDGETLGHAVFITVFRKVVRQRFFSNNIFDEFRLIFVLIPSVLRKTFDCDRPGIAARTRSSDRHGCPVEDRGIAAATIGLQVREEILRAVNGDCQQFE